MNSGIRETCHQNLQFNKEIFVCNIVDSNKLLEKLFKSSILLMYSFYKNLSIVLICFILLKIYLSYSSRLRLSEKKKKRRQEKYAKRLKSPKEITQFLDASGSESSSEDGSVSPAQQKGEPVKPRRQARGNRICDDSSEISSEDENGAEKSKGSRTQSRNKACDSSSDESTTENRKSDKDEIGRNQRKRELFPIGGQNKEIETESGKKTPPSEERDRQRTVQTSPAPSHQRRQSGDNRIISPGVVNGKRRQRFESSEEAHAEMVARSPRAACCSDINTVSGKIQ